jgi:hypothetical protein
MVTSQVRNGRDSRKTTETVQRHKEKEHFQL